jgi:hypothetical protein
MTDPDLETVNKQVLADTFYHLVRYALLKIRRDTDMLGVAGSNFTAAAMGESLAASTNAGICGERSESTVATLLEKARQSSLPFRFYWKGAKDGSSLCATFRLSYEAGDLKVELLWLGLPEIVPISPRVRAIDDRKPLEEAVFELLVVKSGRLSAYAPPV